MGRIRVVYMVSLVLLCCFKAAWGAEQGESIHAGTLEGRVIERETGKGMAGVQLWIDPAEWTKLPRVEATTDGAGLFYFRNARDFGGGFTIHFERPPGYLPDNGLAGFEGYSVGDPGRGRFPEVVIAFARAAQARAILLRQDGVTPAGGAIVSISSGYHMPLQQVTTAPDGAFEFEAPYDITMVIQALEGTQVALFPCVFPRAHPVEEQLRIVMEEGVSVSGTVRDQAGTPVAGYPVQAAALRNIHGDPAGSKTLEPVSERPQLSGADGVYTINGIPPGEIEVRSSLTRPGFTLSEQELAIFWRYGEPKFQRFEVTPGQSLTSIDVNLEEGGALVGTVLDSGGKAVWDARAFVREIAGPWASNVTVSKDGSFRVAGLPARTPLEFSAYAPGYNREILKDITSLSGPLAVTLRPTSPVQFTFRSATGEPLEGARYQLLRRAGKRFYLDSRPAPESPMNKEGQLTFRGFEDGEWRIEARWGGVLADRAELLGATQFTVDGDHAPKELLVVLDLPHNISGQVVSKETGNPVEGVNLRFERLNTEGIAYLPTTILPAVTEALTGPTGEFACGMLFPGRMTMIVEKEGVYTRQPVEVVIPSHGDPPPLKIELSSGATIEGLVTGVNGEPLPGVVVHLQSFDPDGGMTDEQATTDPEGRYRVGPLKRADWNLSFSNEANGHMGTRKVSVVPGQVYHEDLDLTRFVEVSGILRINGKPVDRQQTMLTLISEKGGTRSWLSSREPETYSVNLVPGRYSLYLTPIRTGPPEAFRAHALVASLVIASAPSRQTRDLDLHLGSADVSVAFPQPGDFAPGDVSVFRVLDDPLSIPGPGTNARMTASDLKAEWLPYGLYRATFRSGNGEWYGTSGEFTVGEGEAPRITIPVRKSSARVPVGIWSIAQSGMEYALLEFTATSQVPEAGEFDILMEYEAGDQGLAIEYVALAEDGIEHCRDAHLGWSGAIRRDHSYRLRLDKAEKGRRYTVRVSCAATGSSTGKVYLARP